MAKLDMVQVTTFQKAGYALSGRYDLVDSQFIYGVKNPIGFPVDIRRYDANFIYDQQTEVNWQDPDYVKVHVANGGRGMLVSKRFMDSEKDFPSQPLITPDAPFMFIKGCKWDYQLHSVGQTSYEWEKPVVMDWGGDVGKQLTYLLNYYWSGKSNREQYYYVPPFGLVKWNHGVLQPNGSYKLDNDPAPSNKLQTLADWQKTYPAMTKFTYNLPFKSPVNF